MPSPAARLRSLLAPGRLDFILEAHNGLSARIAAEAGFPAIWASGLSISASLGVRDNNEASWTQVLEVAEFMADATDVPILIDGDTGHGNFNNFRRFTRKLEDRGIAGVCIEDKIFPKTNSFLRGAAQPLADVDEFCGKLRAARDGLRDPDFVLVARTEAFIAGWGLAEALRRAEAYRRAGADAIIVHSASPRPDEVFSFLDEWAGRHPVILIPTKYHTTPAEAFEKRGVSALIWANHLMRASLAAMRDTAARIARERGVSGVEERIAPLSEVFRLQGDDELREAEGRYLATAAGGASAIILAATRGGGLLEPLTRDRPKTLLPVGGVSLLERICGNLEGSGVADLAVVAGYRADAISRPGLQVFVNQAWESTGELASLALARARLRGPCLVVFGDMLCRRAIFQTLLQDEGDIVLAVDRGVRAEDQGRALDVVRWEAPSGSASAWWQEEAAITGAANTADHAAYGGRWIGALKLSARGAAWFEEALSAAGPAPSGQIIELVQSLVEAGRPVKARFVSGDWITIESLTDLASAGNL